MATSEHEQKEKRPRRGRRPKLLSVAEVSEILGINHRAVRFRAARRGVGQRVGQRILVFTAQDLKILQAKP